MGLGMLIAMGWAGAATPAAAAGRKVATAR